MPDEMNDLPDDIERAIACLKPTEGLRKGSYFIEQHTIDNLRAALRARLARGDGACAWAVARSDGSWLSIYFVGENGVADTPEQAEKYAHDRVAYLNNKPHGIAGWKPYRVVPLYRAPLAAGVEEVAKCCSCCLVDGDVARKRDMAQGGGDYRVVGLRSPYLCAECAESHGVGQRGPRPKCKCAGAIGPHVAGSSNGKTSGLGPEDGGSTPPPAATSSAALCDARVVEDAEKALVFLRAAMLENSDGEHPISEYLTRIDDALTTCRNATSAIADSPGSASDAAPCANEGDEGAAVALLWEARDAIVGYEKTLNPHGILLPNIVGRIDSLLASRPKS